MQEYFSLLTATGANALINAVANKTPVKLSKIAVSDSEIAPSEAAVELENTKPEFAINSLTQDPQNPSILNVEGVIPSNVGGFNIRKFAIFTQRGEMFAVGRVPLSYKPALNQGAGSDLVFKIRILIGNVSNIELKVDNSVVLATRDWSEKTFLKLTDKIDAYTKPESDKKFLEKTVADESFALKTELPSLATETKVGITKLKNSVTAKAEDVAVTEKAVVDFVQSHTQPSLGIDQSWSDVTSSRDTNITYTNSTDKPIMVMISGEPNMEGDLFIFVNGVKIYTQELDSMAETSISFIVPPKATYRAEAYYGNGGSSPRKLENIFNSRYKLWAELR